MVERVNCLSFIIILLCKLALFTISYSGSRSPPLPPTIRGMILTFNISRNRNRLSTGPRLRGATTRGVKRLVSPTRVTGNAAIRFHTARSGS